MDQLIQFSNFDTDPWKVVNDATVNPSQADAFLPYSQGSTQIITMTYSKADAGALAAWGTGIYAHPYVALDFEAYIDDVSLAQARCLEFDWKQCVKAVIGVASENVGDGSAQLNLAEGGMWQIDDANQKWVDTGFKPGPPPANVWVPYSFRYFYDAPNGKFSVLSIMQGNFQGAVTIPFQILPSMQGLPLLSTTWTGSALQRQLVGNQAPGAVTMRYRASTLRLSTEPIP